MLYNKELSNRSKNYHKEIHWFIKYNWDISTKQNITIDFNNKNNKTLRRSSASIPHSIKDTT